MSQKKSADFEEILEGVDFKRRRIYFGSVSSGADDEDDLPNEFSWKNVEIVIRAMHKMIADYPNKPIEIHMSSPGGEVTNLLRLVAEVEQSTAQIIFIGSGEILSSAAYFMSTCDERIVMSNTRIMVHEMHTSSEGAHTSRKIDERENEDIQEELYKILANNSRMPIDFWKGILQRDLYLTPKEAKMLGLVDKIIEPRKRGNLRKSRQLGLQKQVDKKDMTRLVKMLYRRVYKGSSISNLELHIPVEYYDRNLIVDNAPIEDKKEEKKDKTDNTDKTEKIIVKMSPLSEEEKESLQEDDQI